MLLRWPPGIVATVHDIITWLVRHYPVLRINDYCLGEHFDRLALADLRRAVDLIADSIFTKASLQLPDVTVADSVVVMLGMK